MVPRWIMGRTLSIYQMSLFGGMSAAFMLFGFSLLYGIAGSTNLGEVAKAVAAKGLDPLVLIALVIMGLSLRLENSRIGRAWMAIREDEIAARACGIAMHAFELGISYAQQRETFGKKIAEHQAVQFRLADMAVKVEAAHQMMVRAARKKDAGERNDLEAGMAKYIASEYCTQVVEDSFRIHGGYGYAKEYEIERLYREAPMLMIGEGTADIQRMIKRCYQAGFEVDVVTADLEDGAVEFDAVEFGRQFCATALHGQRAAGFDFADVLRFSVERVRRRDGAQLAAR